MAKRILVIDESSLFREFLKQKLEEYGFEIEVAVNGLDGWSKLRADPPDLVVMDYYLSRISSLELLQKKADDKNVAGVPVIMASARIDRDKIIQVARYNVRKFFTKPIKIDALLNTVAELLGVKLDLDNTPSIIEAHFNDEILFIEVAQGLNREKIELLRYKIKELLELYEVKTPKVLLMMSSIEVTSQDSLKLATLIQNIVEYSGARPAHIKILTNSDYVQRYIENSDDFAEVEVTNSLETAMDGLLGRKAGSYMDSESRTVQQEFLTASAPKKDSGETINMKFEGERTQDFHLNDLGSNIKLAVVDDDFVIQELIKTAFSDTEFQVSTYDNGAEFLADYANRNYDLVFLDLMMPEMNGFQVLEEVNSRGGEKPPIIVLSALSKRETVIDALKYGVKSYIIKPLKPEWIRKKATEVLKLNF
ncbi:MAG: response regulator [Spirochaetes bacterium]|jgi:DNA-binding response OmpR family regulator|nr:response regulator [Spirochaetota bacterium]